MPICYGISSAQLVHIIISRRTRTCQDLYNWRTAGMVVTILAQVQLGAGPHRRRSKITARSVVVPLLAIAVAVATTINYTIHFAYMAT